MKILTNNGYRYSKEEFEGHTNRVKFRLSVSEDWRKDICIDIYTDNPNKEEVNNFIVSKTSEKVVKCELEHWTTKEQDDVMAQFLEETLKDL